MSKSFADSNCYNCCYDCCDVCEYECIPGPRGFRGEQGPVGPTGAMGEPGNTAVLRGIQLQLMEGKNLIIPVNGVVIFDRTINNQTEDIQYNPLSGEFTITKLGNYYVTWWIASEGATNNNLLEFSIVTNLSEAAGATPLVTGQISGSALISAVSVPTIMMLKNTSTNDITLAETSVQANIVIMQIS